MALCALSMPKRLILHHWKCMDSFTQWIEKCITLATYEQIAYRCRTCMKKCNEI